MNIFKIVLAFYFVFLLFVFSSLSYAVTGNGEYFQIKTSKFNLVYADLSQLEIKKTLEIVKYSLFNYEKRFSWKIDQIPDIVIASKFNQISNAFATSYAYPHAELYRFGIDSIDVFAFSSWGKLVLYHELSHLYQLNMKRELSKYAFSLFGNHLYGPSYLFWFGLPNVFLPNFILEGHAVYIESRFGQGGRLFSGEIKAIVYNLILNNKITYTSLLNEHLNFPFGSEKYWVGGYFFDYLSHRYGDEKVSDVFYAHANHYFNPLLISTDYKDVFDENLQQLLKDFFDYIKKIANKQNAINNGKIIFKNQIKYYPMTSSNDFSKIYFPLVNGHTASQVIEVDKKTLKIKKYNLDLKDGRIFKVKVRVNAKSEFVTAASAKIDPYKIVTSLWDKDRKNISEYNNFYITDIKNGHVSKIDVSKSFIKTKCFVDKKYYDCDSIPLLDLSGKPHFFKSKNDTKVLYVGDDRTCSIKGFYAKVVDAFNDRTWFVASTKYGSSLFLCKKNKVYRISKSDLIVDARFLNNNKAIVVEANSNGYNYTIVKLDIIKEKKQAKTDKAVKNRILESKSLEKFTSTNFEIKKISNSLFQVNKPKKYNSLFNMSYNYLDVSYNDFNFGSKMLLSAFFSDALNYNSLKLGFELYDYGYLKTPYIWFNYLNSANFFKFGISYFGEVQSNLKGAGSLYSLIPLYAKDTKEVVFKVNYDLSFQKNYYASTNSAFSYELSYKNQKLKFLSLYPYYLTKFKFISKRDNKYKIFKFKHMRAFNKKLYISFEEYIQLSQSYYFEYIPRSSLYSLNRLLNINNNNLWLSNKMFTTRVGLKVPFLVQYYSWWLPLGIRRISPFITIENQYNGISNNNFNFWGGFDFEFLTLHKVVTVGQIIFLDMISSKKMLLNFKSRF